MALIVLVLFQAFLLIFNLGDCGDEPGIYNFIQMISKLFLSTREICHNDTQPIVTSWISGQLIFYLYISYLFFIVLSAVYLFFNTYKELADFVYSHQKFIT